MSPADVKRSKRLALVLRHRPEAVGLTLDEQGWVPVERLLRALAEHGLTMTRADLRRVVDDNDKQRFEWDLDQDRIRARQGHTVAVDLALDPATPPDVLFHGTPARNLSSILATGLDSRGRHHVHLSADAATAQRVGARRGQPVVLVVDAAAMVAAGHLFWRTTNGVWLAEHVPAAFISEPVRSR